MRCKYGEIFGLKSSDLTEDQIEKVDLEKILEFYSHAKSGNDGKEADRLSKVMWNAVKRDKQNIKQNIKTMIYNNRDMAIEMMIYLLERVE